MLLPNLHVIKIHVCESVIKLHKIKRRAALVDVTHFWPVCSSHRHTVTVLLADWLLRDERCFVFSGQEKLLAAAPQTCQGFSSGIRYNRIVKIIASQDPEEHTAGQRLCLVALGGGATFRGQQQFKHH